MRKVVLTAALVLASGTAMASSIEVVKGSRASNGSVISISCGTCPVSTPKPAPVEAPVLSPGTQTVSVRDIDGRTETVRTEAWLGGSPVTFVSANPVWLSKHDTSPAVAAGEVAPGTDTAIKTSALPKKEATPSSDGPAVEFADIPLRPTH